MCPIFCLKVKKCEELVPISESWKSRVQRSNDHILRADLLKNPRKKCSVPIIINSDASGWWNPMCFFSPKSDLVQIQWLNSSSSHHLPVNNGQKLGVNPPLKENTQPAVMVLAIYPRISRKWSYFYMWRVSIYLSICLSIYLSIWYIMAMYGYLRYGTLGYHDGHIWFYHGFYHVRYPPLLPPSTRISSGLDVAPGEKWPPGWARLKGPDAWLFDQRG